MAGDTLSESGGDYGEMMTTCNMQSGLDPENERTSAENQRNPHAVALVKSIVPMLLFQSGTRTGFT